MLRALVAEVQDQRYLRAATSLPENLIAALLHAHGALELPTIPDLPAAAVATYLAEMPESEWSDQMLLLYSELHTVRALYSAEEPEVHVAGLSSATPAEDVGQREEFLEGMAAAVEGLEGQAPGTPTLAPDFVSEHEHAGEGTKPDTKPPKLPRVDPPPVEDEPGQAIREDTPGYIAQAFPRLSPARHR